MKTAVSLITVSALSAVLIGTPFAADAPEETTGGGGKAKRAEGCSPPGIGGAFARGESGDAAGEPCEQDHR